MKRSEMITFLFKFLNEYRYCNQTNEQLANWLLDSLEEQGMQPPEIPMDHHLCHPENIYANEWEKE